MYKLLIVDDEILSRFAIHTFIFQNFENIQVTGECENGLDAIAAVEKNEPDFIIMDNKMPGMSGIEASGEILKKHPDVCIVIMTAYDRFDYIQQAMEIGIQAYILKPLNEMEVINKLENLMQRKKRAQQQQSNNFRNTQLVSQAFPVLERELVSLYLNETTDQDEIKKYEEILNIEKEGGFFILVLARQASGKPLSNYLKQEINEVISKRLSFLAMGLVGKFQLDILPVFIYDTGKYNENYLEQEKSILAAELIKHLKTKLQLNVSIAVGKIYRKREEYQKSYLEAFSIIYQIKDNTYEFYQNGSVFPKEAVYPIHEEYEVLEALKAKNVSEAKEKYRKLFIPALFFYDIPLMMLKEYAIQFIVSVKRILYNQYQEMEMMESLGFLQRMEHIHTKEELQSHLETAFQMLCSVLEQQTAIKNYAVLKKINAYLKNTPLPDISLEGLADYLGLSLYYVSKIFKDEYKESFVDYVIKKRIAYSKKLLEKRVFSVREVAEQVGYHDQNYFCRIFKKSTGFTPKEYQKNVATIKKI